MHFCFMMMCDINSCNFNPVTYITISIWAWWSLFSWKLRSHGPLARYVKLWFAHASEMPGTFSPPPSVSNPDMHHGTCVAHVPWSMTGSLTNGFRWSRWRGKRSRHSRRMRNPQLYVFGKRPISKNLIKIYIASVLQAPMIPGKLGWSIELQVIVMHLESINALIDRYTHVINDCWLISPWTKWQSFCRQYCQKHFREWNVWRLSANYGNIEATCS